MERTLKFQQLLSKILLHQPNLSLTTARDMPRILQSFQILKTFFSIANQDFGYCILNPLFSTKAFLIKFFKILEAQEKGFLNVTCDRLVKNYAI